MLFVGVSVVALPPEVRQESSAVVAAVGNGTVNLACALVGLAIVVRRRRNRIGWVYVLIGLGFSLANVLGAYVGWAQAPSPFALPGAVWAALLMDVAFVLSVAPGATMLLLLFPTVRLPSSRWRVVVALLVVGVVGAATSMIFMPGPVEQLPGASNPLQLSRLGLEVSPTLLASLESASFIVLVLCVVAAVASLVVRWRRSEGVERQQIKWLAWGATAAITLYVGTGLAGAVFGISPSATAHQPLFPCRLGLSACFGDRDPSSPPLRHRSSC